MTLRTLAIVGVGLIGGSIALAARSRRVARHIVGIGPDAAQLEQARQRGMLDAWHHELEPAVRDADAVVVCTPVDQIANVAFEAAAYGRADTLVTDVGSTKAGIVNNLLELMRQGTCFVGGHPLAGSEKSGPQYADVRLFENRLVVLTPHEWFAKDAEVRATAFWQALGARVKVMSAADHDRALALTSHLPHLIAAALAAMLPDDLRELAASGFRDTTRVAAGDPKMWMAIFEHNEAAVVDALLQFRTVLEHRCLFDPWNLGRVNLNLREIHDLLIDAKRNRDALGS